MEVKPAQRSVEKQFSGTQETRVERFDFGDVPAVRVTRRTTRPASGPDLQNIGAKVGRLVAHVRAALLNALRNVLAERGQPKGSVMSSVVRKLDLPHASVGADFDVVEITPESPVTFTGPDLSAVYCFDLNRYDLRCAADWITRVKKRNRVLPQILVVGPRRPLSNHEYEFIAEEIAPVAVYLPRPSNVGSSEDLRRVVREEILKVMEPQRLKLDANFEAGEAHGLVVPGG
jgi:hypothetical protein